MTTRGPVALGQIVPGDSVLTSRSRFRRVAHRHDAHIAGDVATFGELKVAFDAQMIASPFERIAVGKLSAYSTVMGVSEEEWADSLARCERGMAMRARGMTIAAPQGAIVLGVSPEAILGRALLIMRSDAYVSTGRVFSETYDGLAAELVLADRDLDECAVYERFPIGRLGVSAGPGSP